MVGPRSKNINNETYILPKPTIIKLDFSQVVLLKFLEKANIPNPNKGLNITYYWLGLFIYEINNGKEEKSYVS